MARQRVGFMIGLASGPAICRMVLLVAEMRALASAQYAAFCDRTRPLSWSGLRYIDDARLWVRHPRSLAPSVLEPLLYEFASILWPTVLPWKPDAMNPTVGLFVFRHSGGFDWFPEPKACMVDGAFRYAGPGRVHKTFQDACSWLSPASRLGCLTGVWCKCYAQSSSPLLCALSVLLFARVLFRCHRFPSAVLVDSVRSTMSKRCWPQNQVYRALPTWIRGLLERGEWPPELVEVMQTLPLNSYVSSCVTF